MTRRIRVHDLRERAEHLLANEAPSAAESHELAALLLESLDLLGGEEDRHPFREPARREEMEENAALVALERSLEASEARLRSAQAEIDTLRRGRT